MSAPIRVYTAHASHVVEREREVTYQKQVFKLCSQILDVLIFNIRLRESPVEVLGHSGDLRKRVDKSGLLLSIEGVKVFHVGTGKRE